jgi:spermidine synthase
MHIKLIFVLITIVYSYGFSNKNVTNNTYFQEASSMNVFDDLYTSLKAERIVYRSTSKYQDIAVFYNNQLGNVLALDGILQLSDWDEFAYHEMAVHIPLFAHPNPKNVLIIGGGDGGCAREVLKHSTIEKVVLVEIDEEVVNVSRKYFPNISVSLDHPKLRVRIGDGFEFIRKCAMRARPMENGEGSDDLSDPDVPSDGKFDVIITDSSEMDEDESPNEALFQEQYFQNIKGVIRAPHGIVSSLVGSPWLYIKLQRQLYSICQKTFSVCRFASFSVPSWDTGREGLLIASIDPNADLEQPHQQQVGDLNTMKLRYYNKNMHNAAFALPKFISEKLEIQQESNEKDN